MEANNQSYESSALTFYLLTATSVPFEYKYVVYNHVTGEVQWEPTPNRIMEFPGSEGPDELEFEMNDKWKHPVTTQRLVYTRPARSSRRQAVVVLGRRLQADGQPSAILRNRMKVATELVKSIEAKELAISKEAAVIYLIVTGGRNLSNKESKSEASVMKAIALESGIAEDRIIVEDEALNTIENALNVVDLSAQHRISKATIVTSDFHMPRARKIFSAVFEDSRLKTVPELAFVEDKPTLEPEERRREQEIEDHMLLQLETHLGYYL
eukprot:TRINITY_DN3726_c0_g1_i2.p1 TRINITY_DN3726_c0_g1~~TRINITY_DN3726_c0_g1_i2.p1  ORF type:complete len:268 (+),score=64.91 TRINITY_DN3726_c0_g1_i2:109-912(+)